MMTHKTLVKKMLKQPAVRAEYDAHVEEFALLDELLKARRQAGLTQAEVAARMGTKTPAIARLEAGGGARRHSLSVATLRNYAEAVGCRVEIRLRPRAARNASTYPTSPPVRQQPCNARPMATRRPKQAARIARNIRLALEKVAENL